MIRFESSVALPRFVQRPLGLLLGAALLMAALTVGSTSALAQFAGPTPLVLQNGWTNAPFTTSRATVEIVTGMVQLRGAIATAGSNPVAFTLGPAFRPLTNVYVPVDLCNSAKGRLVIQPTGVVSVQAEKAFSSAQCFTSLDGASFATRPAGYTSLALVNGWTNAPFSTSNAAVREVNGIVHFKGAVASGTSAELFVLPAAFRPATNVFIPVDLCDAKNGRLNITPTGVVSVQAELNFSDAQCFTSLDGAWFVPAATSPYKPLVLINGWTNSPFSTSSAAAANAYGMVIFKGAIATSGTNAQPFTLPPAFRPITNVFVPIDLCGANKGRLFIQTTGVVTVDPEGSFSSAQCFTSLDGVSFVQ